MSENEGLSAEQQAVLRNAARTTSVGRKARPAVVDQPKADETDEGEDGFSSGPAAEPQPQRSRNRNSSRGTREQETRQIAEGRRDDQENVSDDWVDPSTLDAPPPQPGMVQRWIRVGYRAHDDARNVSRKFREGWKPRPATTIPAEYLVVKVERGQIFDGLFVNGMLLCEMPIELAEKRSIAIRRRSERMSEGIDNDLLKVQRPQAALGQITRATQTTVVNTPAAARRAAAG